MLFRKFICSILALAIFFSYGCPAWAENLPREYFYFVPRTIVRPVMPVEIPARLPQTPDVSKSKDSRRTKLIEKSLDEAALDLSQSAVTKTSSSAVAQEPNEIKVISIDEIISSSPGKPSIRLIYRTSVIIQVKNIQRFLVMDEGFINVQKLDHNQIKVDALKYGGTFLNIWDDAGRRTIYVGVVFPPNPDEAKDRAEQAAQKYEDPFRFFYSNDWNTYYYGAKGEDFKKRSYSFLQNFGLEGQTPYGFLDTSMSEETTNGRSLITSYTLGLNQIPVDGTSNFNLRAFDSNRTTSPLTMSSTTLRGVFADVDLFHDLVGLSYDYGQKRPYSILLNQSSSSQLNSYINAYKLTLFPKDYDNQISINAAEGFGSQHEENLVKKVYSVEARKKIFNTYLNGEYARGDGHEASLAGARWKKGNFTTALNFRQINKNFTTVSAVPSNQGEIGTMWTTSTQWARASEETTLDVYRQYLFFNPNNPNALNLDASGRVRIPLIKDFFSDTSLFYVHTPGEISPRRNVGLDERISKTFNFLRFKNVYAYFGGAMQRNRYEFSSLSEYDRNSVLTGIQVPLTNRLSMYANYEYSWVHELASENDLNPAVLNTGFYYNRQFTEHLSGNFDASYRKENGVAGTSSYLAGEDSAGVSAGLSYNPANDVSFFLDGRARKVWPQIEGNLPYNDLDVRLGMRMSFDVLRRGWNPHGKISGYVYKDKNGDGLYNPSEQGIKNVKVKVGDNHATTDENGYYTMDVKAKSVLVAPQSDTIPAGTVFSTATGQEINVKQWRNTKVDFGLNSQTGIYGLVFVDKNENNVPDETDQFVKGARIIVDKKQSSVSDAQGAFYFRDIAAGEHVLTIDINSLPINMIPQVKLKNEVKVVEGTTYLFHIPLKIKTEDQDVSKEQP